MPLGVSATHDGCSVLSVRVVKSKHMELWLVRWLPRVELLSVLCLHATNVVQLNWDGVFVCGITEDNRHDGQGFRVFRWDTPLALLHPMGHTRSRSGGPTPQGRVADQPTGGDGSGGSHSGGKSGGKLSNTLAAMGTRGILSAVLNVVKNTFGGSAAVVPAQHVRERVNRYTAHSTHAHACSMYLHAACTRWWCAHTPLRYPLCHPRLNTPTPLLCLRAHNPLLTREHTCTSPSPRHGAHLDSHDAQGNVCVVPICIPCPYR